MLEHRRVKARVSSAEVLKRQRASMASYGKRTQNVRPVIWTGGPGPFLDPRASVLGSMITTSEIWVNKRPAMPMVAAFAARSLGQACGSRAVAHCLPARCFMSTEVSPRALTVAQVDPPCPDREQPAFDAQFRNGIQLPTDRCP